MTNEFSDVENANYKIGDVKKSTLTSRFDASKEYSIEYKYDGKRNVKWEKNYRGIISEYTRNYGVVTKTTTYYEKASTTSIVQQQTLDSTGNYVKYVYDERGNGIKMQYDYQDSTGLLLSSITPEQQKTEYTYNEKEELDNMRATVGNRINENAYVYQREYPVRVSHNGVNFDFVYDAKGITKIEIAGANLLRSYHEKLVDYDTTGQRCEVISFVTKNGLYTVRSVYNKNGLLTHKQKYVSSAALESHLNDAVSSSAWSNLLVNKYDEEDYLVESSDSFTKTVYSYEYNAYGELAKISYTLNGRNVTLTSTYSADFHLLASQEFKIGSVSRTYSYQYDAAPDHRITGIELPTGDSVRIKYDNLGRISGHDTRIRTGDMILDETITYLTVTQSSGGTRNTNYVASIKYYQRQGNVYESHGFNYDDNGNISSISVGGVQKRSYQYDGLNRLTRENNAAFNKSVVYEYDAGGNITKKTEYGYTTSAAPSGGVTKTYVYDATNKDRLTSYNGETIGEYDAQGNPWIYRGNALVWERRSALARYGSNTFTYKDDGVRVTKNGIKYFYDGQRLLKEEHADYSLWFYYDDRGVVGFTKSASADLITAQEKNYSTYVFRRNLQGDITHVYNTQGYLYARYEYNAWGEHKIYNATGVEITSGSAYASEIGRINPFRYRSYYYDEETKLYYLMTRYYDPEVGRFISQDNIAYLDPETLGGLNLYAYCGNNPVMGTDPEGTWDWRKFLGWVVDAVIAVAAVAAITVVVVGTVASSGLLGAVLVGAGAGALVAMGGSVVAQGGFSTSDPWQVAKAGGIGAAIGAASGATSWTLGTIGESLGAQLGYAFSNTTHLSSGVKFGKVFSTEFLMSAGKTIGGISGGFIGGAGMNYVLNEGMGNSLNADEAIGQGFMGESPLWMIRFFRWLCV